MEISDWVIPKWTSRFVRDWVRSRRASPRYRWTTATTSPLSNRPTPNLWAPGKVRDPIVVLNDLVSGDQYRINKSPGASCRWPSLKVTVSLFCTMYMNENCFYQWYVYMVFDRLNFFYEVKKIKKVSLMFRVLYILFIHKLVFFFRFLFLFWLK